MTLQKMSQPARMARMLPHPTNDEGSSRSLRSNLPKRSAYFFPDRHDFMKAWRASPFICLLEASALQSFMRCCWVVVALPSDFASPDRHDFMKAWRASPFICLLEASA